MVRTVAEIGRLVGCSSATVSRALNNSGSVSVETRAAVMRALQDTQYLAKRARRRVKGVAEKTGSGSSGGLIEIVLHRHTPTEQLSLREDGLAVGPLAEFPTSAEVFSKPYQLSNSFYRHIIDGALEELTRWGHRAVIQLNGDLLNADFLEEVNRPDRGGVLLVGEHSVDLGKFIPQCMRPLVLVDLIHDAWPDVVTTDNLFGIGLAFDHLYALGHRRIGFIGRSPEVIPFEERFNSFKYKLAEAGLPFNPAWVFEGPNHIEMTSEGVKAILRQEDRPSAFLCSNDCAALGVVRAASSLGINIPGQLSVVGFDDQESASLVTPPLTTVRAPVVEMGRRAVRQLMVQLQLGDVERTRGCRVRLMPELIVRQSAAAVHL